MSPNSIFILLAELILILKALFLKDYDWLRGQCFAQQFIQSVFQMLVQ